MESNDVKLTGFQDETPEIDKTMEPIYNALVESGCKTLSWRDFRIGFLAGLATKDRVVVVPLDTTPEPAAEKAGPTEL